MRGSRPEGSRGTTAPSIPPAPSRPAANAGSSARGEPTSLLIRPRTAVSGAPTASVELRLSNATITVELDTSGTVDVAAERKRLEKDLAEANKELDRAAKKLGNEGFLAKAPEHVVAKIRERQQIAVEEVERISARLAELPEK